MSNKDFLLEHIEKIFDYDLHEIQFSKLEFKYEKRKHSSIYSYVLYLDDNALTRNQIKTYKVQYLCRCGKHIIILLQKYLSKKHICCQHCLQNRSYEYNIYTAPYSIKKGIKKCKEKIIKDFNDYDNDFKLNYKNNHLDYNEFFYYLPYIYRLNNIILTDNIRKNILYKYAYPIDNQFKFDNGITYQSINDIALKCNTCGKIFKVHLNNLRNKDINNIKCKKCVFTSIKYPIQLYKNTNLTYQSNLEKKFLDCCFNYGISVMNGLEIPYWFNNKLHTYITDFYLPDLKIIIEIKGDNHYYKKDLNSGKIDAKNNAAINYVNNHNMKFEFILEDIDNFFEKIIK